MLIEREKEFEKILLALHNIGIGKESIGKMHIIEDIKNILAEWSILVGNKNIFTVLEPLFFRIKNETDENTMRKNIRLLDLIISPLEHYMISLEEFKNNSFRDSTTRCGMSIERITNQLWIELKTTDTPFKVEDRIGVIQYELNKKTDIKGVMIFAI